MVSSLGRMGIGNGKSLARNCASVPPSVKKAEPTMNLALAPEPREQIRASPIVSILSRLANPGPVLPMCYRFDWPLQLLPVLPAAGQAKNSLIRQAELELVGEPSGPESLRDDRGLLVALLILFHSALAVAAFGLTRFRMPVMPFLIARGALSLHSVWRRVASRRIYPRGSGAGV